MSFAAITTEIARGFPKAKKEALKAHPLVNRIERHWRAELERIVGPSALAPFSLDSSAGIGAWNAAPWLAVFHPSVTKSARLGFYPVYLFEAGFKTVCLVMGQGAACLEEAVGKRAALVELQRRALILRERGGDWASAGFTAGPFQTLRKAAVASSGDAGHNDPWSVSVAFGKRYYADAMPSDVDLANDLEAMLKIYSALVARGDLDFSTQDDSLLKLKESGELPHGSVDGAKKIIKHKNLEVEVRQRNAKLISAVKKNLGYSCAACNFRFGQMYGPGMDKFIEAHHLVPISTVDAKGVTLKATEEDFAVLCSNCHRAIHAAGCPSLPDFKKRLQRKLKLEPV